MKRFSMVFLLLTCVFVTTAMAGHPVAKTVAEAKVSAVDTDVALTGRFVKKINDGSFLFSDGTGELLVHVKGDELDQSLMTADVDLTGMVVQDFMYTEVRADSVSAHN